MYNMRLQRVFAYTHKRCTPGTICCSWNDMIPRRQLVGKVNVLDLTVSSINANYLLTTCTRRKCEPLLQFPRVSAKIAITDEIDSEEFMLKFWKYIMKENIQSSAIVDLLFFLSLIWLANKIFFGSTYFRMWVNYARGMNFKWACALRYFSRRS